MLKAIFIRVLASVLPISVSIAAILTFAASFDYHISILLVIGLLCSLIWMLARFEDIVEDVEDLIDALTSENEF